MMKNKEDLRTDNEPEKKQTGLHHFSSERKSAERFNLDKDESTRNNRKVIVAHEQECDGEEEDANKDGTVIQEQAQDIADTTQPGNVDKTTEACRTSTRNKKNPSFIVNEVYSWENDTNTSKPMNSKNIFKIFHQNI